jgi:hypothetical protein
MQVFGNHKTGSEDGINSKEGKQSGEWRDSIVPGCSFWLFQPDRERP